MALRLNIAIFLSLVFHFLVLYRKSPTTTPAIAVSNGESFLVDILPGGQTKFTSLPLTHKKNEFKTIANSVMSTGNGAGTGVGIGSGSGEGIQTDWMVEKPIYSEESRRNEEEGKVDVIVACKLNLGCSGTIKKSSGHYRLDQAVLRTVQKIKSSKDEIRELSFVFKLEE